MNAIITQDLQFMLKVMWMAFIICWHSL